MATLVTDLRRYEIVLEYPAQAPALTGERSAEAPLRPIPNEDVYLFSKTVDNSRLLRQSDARVVRQCWMLSAKFGLLVVLGVLVLMPKLAYLLLGYRINNQAEQIVALRQDRDTLRAENEMLRAVKRLRQQPSRLSLQAAQPYQVQQLVPLEKTPATGELAQLR